MGGGAGAADDSPQLLSSVVQKGARGCAGPLACAIGTGLAFQPPEPPPRLVFFRKPCRAPLCPPPPQVRRKPYSVVLLDEVEKAHADVFNVLLQVRGTPRAYWAARPPLHAHCTIPVEPRALLVALFTWTAPANPAPEPSTLLPPTSPPDPGRRPRDRQPGARRVVQELRHHHDLQPRQRRRVRAPAQRQPRGAAGARHGRSAGALPARVCQQVGAPCITRGAPCVRGGGRRV